MANILATEQLTLQEVLDDKGNEDEIKYLKVQDEYLLVKTANKDENGIISLTKPRPEVKFLKRTIPMDGCSSPTLASNKHQSITQVQIK